ncbi:MAG: transposase, partial [Candidatus Methanoperedens sp.]
MFWKALHGLKITLKTWTLRIFELLKSRVEIEVTFDTFKNVLNADRSYMRDDSAMEGWMFVNFIALLLY